MAVTTNYTTTVNASDKAQTGGGTSVGFLASLVTPSEIAGVDPAPSSGQSFMRIRRGDSLKFNFTNQSDSTVKLVVTPQENIFTSNSATTLTLAAPAEGVASISHSTGATYTLASNATLGKQSNNPVLKIEAQDNSGNVLDDTDVFESANPSYLYVNVEEADTGTVTEFSISYTPGSLKQNASLSLTRTDGSSTGLSSGSPMTPSEGDILKINGEATAPSEPNLVSSTAGLYGGPPNITNSGLSFFTRYPPSGTNSNHVEYVVNDVATANNVVQLQFVRSDYLSTARRSIYLKVAGDSLPSSFSAFSTTSSEFDTYYEKSLTVAGVGSGKSAIFFIRGANVAIPDQAEIKVGSGEYYDYVLAGTGDVLTLRAKSSADLGFGKLYKVIGMQGDGQAVVSDWTITAPAIPDNTYGMEFYNSSGTKLLSVNDKGGRFVDSGTVTFTNHADNTEKTETKTITGITTDEAYRVLTFITPSQTDENLSGVFIREGRVTADDTLTITTFSDNDDNATITYTISYIILYAE